MDPVKVAAARAGAQGARQHFDPVGRERRPDIVRLCLDTSPRRAVIETAAAPGN
jgi:hypothetical protein